MMRTLQRKSHTAATGLRSYSIGVLTTLVVACSAVTSPGVLSAQLSDDVIDRAGESVMQGNEFRSVRRRVLEQIPDSDIDKGFLQGAIEWLGRGVAGVFRGIGDFFDWLFNSSASSPASPRTDASPRLPSAPSGVSVLPNLLTALVIAFILAVLIFIAVIVVRSFDAGKRRQNRLAIDGSDLLSDSLLPPGELAASTYETRAIQLAADGNLRAAIRELLLGGMSWIERAGMIRYRRGLTNRDYLRSVWKRQSQREAFLTMALQFEYVYFGRRVPTAEMFQSCLSGFRGAFREEETPTAAV